MKRQQAVQRVAQATELDPRYQLEQARETVVRRRSIEDMRSREYEAAKVTYRGSEYALRKLSHLAQARAFREEAEAIVVFWEGVLEGKWPAA